MLQLTPTNCAQRPRCAPGSSPPDGVSQGHFNLTPHSRLGLALIPNYNAPTAPSASPHLSQTGMLYPPPLPVSHLRPLSARGLHPCPTVGALFLGGSENVFTIPAIITRPSPVFSPNSHSFRNHFPEGHQSFNYSSPSTLNSGVTYRPLTEKVSALC
ncbi:unnamed protein product [Microthlaspi erraticum]|uniref:Uncharacterized protein n=1 Tax=Microthlaspi erraticum TaxID=1685480 RepID=A0A6D2HV14_9BRAS|nr:unnamed protein product [Microthlaspi erraticum]